MIENQNKYYLMYWCSLMKIIFNSYYTTTKMSPNPEIPGFIKIGFQTDVVKYTLFYKQCLFGSLWFF